MWKEGGHRLRYLQRSCSRNATRHILIVTSPLVSAALIFAAVTLLKPQESENLRHLEHRVIHPQFNASLRSLEKEVVPFWAPDLRSFNLTHESVALTPLSTTATHPVWDKATETEMRFNYLSDEKKQPYVGAKLYTTRFRNGTRRWFNSLAVFPKSSQTGDYRMHGLLGVDNQGQKLWKPIPMPPPVGDYPGGMEAALKNGGFYLNLSNALPVDRPPPDNREPVCRTQSFDLSALPDASIVITFYNEPLSTLLRTVHSVLNHTPPPILREIILVDDHSNSTENLPGSALYSYIDYLPKVKLMRLGYRRGLVHARLAGARAATGKVLVVLDSHIEVNPGWLEPQLARIAERPDAIVFPQILAINPENFEYDKHSGIGCKISFRWSMVEQSSLTAKVEDPAPIPSPSMAGGLFAADLDYFWHLGGYDEGFSMWGAENVEMGFRTWQCGGRLECLPCAKTYHIYRKKGHGYESPHDAVVVNRLRAARVWTDEFFAIAKLFIAGPKAPDMGNLDKMLDLKERLKCRPFKWFLDTIDPGHDIRSVESIEYHGEIRNMRFSQYCLDTMSHTLADEEYDVFPCHGEGGTQSWVKLKETNHIIPVSNERMCMSKNLKFQMCKDGRNIKWKVINVNQGQVQIKIVDNGDPKCLGINEHRKIAILNCDINDPSQVWKWLKFTPSPVPPLTFSQEHKNRSKT